ncbi:sugar kinase [Saccharibacillus brassicae]|uniref:Sugar kinase n=1 Tax=Saccharibacillus brassicae TaxID=2583377 RepID=A0A4Y6UUH0_SACBS|nr:sugar kinase [Saccharibacillus brassicae]QDH21329.1 sugar kinase [Saccharibacillus brassicae]
MPKSVAAFGEVMMRLETPGFRLLSQTDTLQVSYSGSGVNVLSALSRFGHLALPVTTLPDNPVGDAAEANLRKLGLLPHYIRRDGMYLGMYILEAGFGARPGRVTYTNRQQSSFNLAAEGAYPFDEAARAADVVHFCGIALAMNDTVRRNALRFAEAVRAAGGTVAFDCNYRPGLWGPDGYAQARPWYEKMLQLAQIVFMNENDAIHVLGLPLPGGDRLEQLQALMPVVAGRYGTAVLAGTHRGIESDGRHSLLGYLYRAGEFHFSDRLTFPVYDRIGAGDAYASGILHGELSDFPADRTVRFAAAASMLAHTIAGDTPFSSEAQIFRAMNEGAGDIER